MADAGTQMTQDVIAALCSMLMEEMRWHQNEHIRLGRKLERLQERCSHPETSFGFFGAPCSVCGKDTELDLPV